MRAKTVFTEIGPVQIEVPRDTNSSFDPQIVNKRKRRLTGVDEIVLSLMAEGLTTGPSVSSTSSTCSSQNHSCSLWYFSDGAQHHFRFAYRDIR